MSFFGDSTSGANEKQMDVKDYTAEEEAEIAETLLANESIPEIDDGGPPPATNESSGPEDGTEQFLTGSEGEEEGPKGIDPEIKRFVEEISNEFNEESKLISYPIVSLRTKRKAYELHKSEPDYWTPIRLSNLFKMDSQEMKIMLWDMRMEAQAMEAGVEFDYSLHDAMETKFGVVDFPDNIPDTPTHIYRKQTKRTFFYIPAEIPSNLLMQHLNKIESKAFREGVKLQPRKAPPTGTVYPPMMASGLKTTKKHKNNQILFMDTSNNLDAFAQPMIVKDFDGTLRDATWDERKEMRIVTSHTRHYEPVPYNVWDDKTGKTPAEHTPPPGFQVDFEDA